MANVNFAIGKFLAGKQGCSAAVRAHAEKHPAENCKENKPAKT